LRTARRLFQGIVEARLAKLPTASGRSSSTASRHGGHRRHLRPHSDGRGSGHGRVVERLLEHDLSGEYPVVVGGATATRLVRGKADRIDLLAGGLLRIIDYKSGKAPRLDRALQLPVYAACAERQLEGRHGRQWTVANAAYVPLAGPRSSFPSLPAPRRETQPLPGRSAC